MRSRCGTLLMPYSLKTGLGSNVAGVKQDVENVDMPVKASEVWWDTAAVIEGVPVKGFPACLGSRHAHDIEPGLYCSQAASTLLRTGSRRLSSKQADQSSEMAVAAECAPSSCLGQMLGGAAVEPWPSQDLYTQASSEAFASSKQALQAFARMAARAPKRRTSLGGDHKESASACRSPYVLHQREDTISEVPSCQGPQASCSTHTFAASSSGEEALQKQRAFSCATGGMSASAQEAAAVFGQLGRFGLAQQQEQGGQCVRRASTSACQPQTQHHSAAPPGAQQHSVSPFGAVQPPMQSGFAAASDRIHAEASTNFSSSNLRSPFSCLSEPRSGAAERPQQSWGAGAHLSPFEAAGAAGPDRDSISFLPRRPASVTGDTDAQPNAFAAVAQSPFGAMASPFDPGAVPGAASAPLSGPAATSQRSAFDSTPAGVGCCQPSPLVVESVDLRKELHIGAFLLYPALHLPLSPTTVPRVCFCVKTCILPISLFPVLWRALFMRLTIEGLLSLKFWQSGLHDEFAERCVVLCRAAAAAGGDSAAGSCGDPVCGGRQPSADHARWEAGEPGRDRGLAPQAHHPQAGCW